jgi:hypothetical protein
MPIRLECPNPKCKVKLTVKDHLAGKRVPCPKCKQPILIPAPVDVEALAAAALGEDGAAQQSQASTIDFICPFCDEELHLPRELGGKQTSCTNPECRRIVKVPMPKDEKPEDWRNLTRTGPTGARENVEAPRLEGAWDTSRATVSGEALIEAGAIQEEAEPVTAAQWVRRGVYATAAVTVLVVGVVGTRWYLSSSRLQSLLEQGLSYAETKSSLKPEWKGALERAAGEYQLDAGQQEKAQRHLMKARELVKAGGGTERDAGLRDVALTQTRLTGTDTREDLSRTFRAFTGDEEARLIAFRDVLGKLLESKQENVAVALVQEFGRAEPPRVIPVGVGIKKEPVDDEGEGEPRVVNPPAPQQQPAPASAESLLPTQQIALDLLRNQTGEATRVRERPKDDPKETPDPIARLGYAEGLARLDKYSEAERLARMPGDPRDRLRTWLALADIARGAGKSDDAARFAHEALRVFDGELKKARISPWLASQLSRAVARAAGDEARAKELADSISDPALKGRAQLETFLLKLEGTKGRMEPATVDTTVSDKATLAYGLALEAVARHNTRAGYGGDEQNVSGLAEELRPFVLLGAALGTQDATKK